MILYIYILPKKLKSLKIMISNKSSLLFQEAAIFILQLLHALNPTESLKIGHPNRNVHLLTIHFQELLQIVSGRETLSKQKTIQQTTPSIHLHPWSLTCFTWTSSFWVFETHELLLQKKHLVPPSQLLGCHNRFSLRHNALKGTRA